MVRSTLRTVAGQEKAGEEWRSGGGAEEEQFGDKETGRALQADRQGRGGTGKAIRGGSIVRCRQFETWAEWARRWLYLGRGRAGILREGDQEIEA